MLLCLSQITTTSMQQRHPETYLILPRSNTYVDNATYRVMDRKSIEGPGISWGEMAEKFVTLHKRWDVVQSGDSTCDNVRWFDVGAFATPHSLFFVHGLLKTRSRKVTRRILRNFFQHKYGALDDISILSEPGVVDDHIAVMRDTPTS